MWLTQLLRENPSGQNCTNLMFHLASALQNSPMMQPGDNIVLSRWARSIDSSLSLLALIFYINQQNTKWCKIQRLSRCQYRTLASSRPQTWTWGEKNWEIMPASKSQVARCVGWRWEVGKTIPTATSWWSRRTSWTQGPGWFLSRTSLHLAGWYPWDLPAMRLDACTSLFLAK